MWGGGSFLFFFSVKITGLSERHLTEFNRIFNRTEFERLIHAFISSQLDYCNSIYIGVGQSYSETQLLDFLMTREFEHISAILLSLCWLVCFRIELKKNIYPLNLWP